MTSYKEAGIIYVAKYQIRHKPTLFCSPLVKTEPTWLRPEELIFEEKEEEEERKKKEKEKRKEKKKKKKKGGGGGGGGRWR